MCFEGGTIFHLIYEIAGICCAKTFIIYFSLDAQSQRQHFPFPII